MSCGKAITIGTAPALAPPAVTGASLGSTIGSTVTGAVTAAAPVLLGVAAAAGAVFLTQAALCGLARFDERYRRESEAYLAQQGQARRWHLAYQQVHACNARIVVLEQQLRRLDPDDGGPQIPLPDPFDPVQVSADALDTGVPPATCDLEQLLAWAEKTTRVLDAAEEQVRLARIRRAARPLPADAPEVVAARERARLAYARAVAVAADDDPLLPGQRLQHQHPEHRRLEHRLRPSVEGILDKLHDKVSPEDYIRLRLQAQAVLDATPQTASSALHTLFLDVQRATEAHAARQAAVEQASLYLAALPVTGPLPSGGAAVVARLVAVVAGEAPFDERLRSDVDTLRRRVERDAREQECLRRLELAFLEQGYQPTVQQSAAGSRPTLSMRHRDDGRPEAEFSWDGQILRVRCLDRDPDGQQQWARDFHQTWATMPAELRSVLHYRETVAVSPSSPRTATDDDAYREPVKSRALPEDD